MKPPVPEHESLRLRELQNLEILDTPPEERFDRITRLASRLLNTPMSLLSLVDADRQWFKSAVGVNLTETPREQSFCAHAIIEQKTFHIEDATHDARFKENPLVTGNPGIRMYAGHPIETSSGLRIGTLCVLDSKPRKLNSNEIEILQSLSEWVKTEIRNIRLEKQWHLNQELMDTNKLQSYSHSKLLQLFKSLDLIDPDFKLPNAVYLDLYLTQEINRLSRMNRPISVITLGPDAIFQFEKKFGKAAVLEAMRMASKAIADLPKWPRGMTFRVDHHTFCVVLPEKNRDLALEMAESIRDAIHRLKISSSNTDAQERMTFSMGISSCVPILRNAEELLKKSQEAYEAAHQSGSGRIRYLDLI